MADLLLFRVAKRCACGKEWEGNSFKPAGPKPIEAYCDECADAEIGLAYKNERLEPHTVRAEDLEPPRLSPELEDF